MTASVIETGCIPAQFREVIKAISATCAQLATILRREQAADPVPGARLEGIFADALRGAGCRWLSVKNRDAAVALARDGAFGVAIDPLNGAAHVDANTPLGTIFSIFPAAESAEATFARPMGDLIAAGYVIYGPRTALAVSFGAGVNVFTLNPDSGCFELTRDQVRLPPEAGEFAINASNYRHWSQPVRAYIDDCLAGTDGPRGQNFNMRWTASLVADTHRILLRGGIFLFPDDERPGYEHGRTSLLHECAPIAFVIENAGGRATNGAEPILSLRQGRDQTLSPFIFGSSDMVDRVATYHDLPPTEISALFGNRGLFRA